ncbi:hypothetical protein HPB47_001729 [Ixodes persulcatus]|uniref:Uncharacterized protein n=1 Tax=Ixodes persulcatus TaxID=34615 RepID=A0AC60PN75_IXOPE|nr:hypothetical protein HPB47_001729 [Ixodes persulcatus]
MNQPSVFVPPELLQTLLQQTDGTPLQREKMAVKVRELLFATPIQAAEEEAAPFVAAAVTEASTTNDQDSTCPWLVPVQPSKFIGFGDLQSPDEFLDHLENFCLGHGAKLEDRLSRVVPAALQGSAKLWFRFTEDFADWSTFATALRKEFAPVDEKKCPKEELRLRTQHSEENLKQLIYVIASYYDRIGDNVTEEEKSSKISGNAPQGPYPVVVERADGTRCLVVQDFWLGKYMGYINVTWNERGEPERWEGQPVLLDNSIRQGENCRYTRVMVRFLLYAVE